MRLKILALAAWGVIMAAGPLFSQVTYQWSATGPSNWNMDENWMDGGNPAVVPDFTFGESAQIGNGGTAIVNSAVPDIEDLTVSNGVLDVQNNGALSMLFGGFDTGGRMTIGSSGRIQVSGNGSLTTERGATNNGTLALTGSSATVQIGGDFTNNGIVEANITGATHSTIMVDGTARLGGGTLLPSLDGVTPAFGDSWDIVQAGDVLGNFTVDASNLSPLERGLQYQSIIDGNTARLTVGNALILNVNRTSGMMRVENAAGGPVDVIGYGVESENGLLNAGGFTGLQNAGVPGWQEANLTNAHLAELNLQMSSALAVGEDVELGNSYAPGPQTPSQEDLVFTYLTSEHQLVRGIVEYSGPANDIVLNVDPVTGEAAISHLSSFVDAVEITGYDIISNSGSLSPASWASFEDNPGVAGANWRKANPTANHLTELNLQESQIISNGTILPLGNLFTPGSVRDLTFQYSTIAGDLLFGTVSYGEVPELTAGLAADFNKDGTVDLQDFNILKGNFGSSNASMAEGDSNMDGSVDLQDFNILKGQFGQSASATVPEPSTVFLSLVGAIGMFFKLLSHNVQRAMRLPLAGVPRLIAIRKLPRTAHFSAFVSYAVLASWLMPLAAKAQLNQNATITQTNDDYVAFEGEWVNTVTGAAPWTIESVDPSFASGGKIIHSPTRSDPDPNFASYNIDFTSAGEYRMYVRRTDRGGNNDSLFPPPDFGANPNTPDGNVHRFNTLAARGWTELGVGGDFNQAPTDQAAIDAAAAYFATGTYSYGVSDGEANGGAVSFSIKGREPISLDRIVLHKQSGLTAEELEALALSDANIANPFTQSEPWLVQYAKNSTTINNTTEAINTFRGTHGSVTEFAEATAPVLNFVNRGAVRDFAGDLVYPNGDSNEDVDDFTVQAITAATIPAGTWTIGVGSDDGARITIPGVSFTSTANENGHNGVGTEEIRFEGNRGHAWTLGTFTLASPLTTTITASFHERGGGDSLEVAIAEGSQASFNVNAFQLLGDNTSGWQLDLINPVDFNQDGLVDLGDFEVLLANFHEPGDFTSGDTNFDGTVDMRDWVKFRAAFNAASPAAVPEPSTLVLLGLGGVIGLVAAIRRRRS